MRARTREGLVLYRLLTIRLAHTTDEKRAVNSRWVWGQCDQHRQGPDGSERCWQLRVLGVLHRLTGLYLELPS